MRVTSNHDRHSPVVDCHNSQLFHAVSRNQTSNEGAFQNLFRNDQVPVVKVNADFADR